MPEWALFILLFLLGFLVLLLKTLAEVTARIGDQNNERLDRLVKEVTAMRREAQEYRDSLEPIDEDD